jgi:photosystem II stability/assembly factor-like uncharacterized protein
MVVGSFDKGSNYLNGAALTTNGGSSWSTVNLPELSSVEGVACTGPTTCVVLAGQQTAHTTDGGNHWSVTELPRINDGNPSLACRGNDCILVFETANLDSATLSSTNGGASWTPASTMPAFVSSPTGLSCPAPGVCSGTFYTIPIDNPPSNTEGVVASTTDNGKTWTVDADAPQGTEFGGIACVSATSCTAIETGANSDRNDPNLIATASTTDGWHSSATAAMPFGVLSWTSASCNPSGRCVAVGTAAGGGGQSAVIISSDGGVDWAYPKTPPLRASFESVSCFAATCVAVGATGNNVYGGDSGVAWSSDGGATWSAADVGDTPFTSVSCGSASSCMAVSGDAVMATTDGGAHWSVVDNLSDYGASGVSCATATDCVVISNDGQYTDSLSTTDFGKSWKTANLDEVYEADGVMCITSTTCISPGGKGESLYGTTWSTVSITRNGAASWATGPGGGNDVPMFDPGASVSCPSAQDCLIASDSGYAISVDGIYHWQSEVVPPAARSAACVSTSDCVTVGADATIEISHNVFGGPVFPQPHGYRLASALGNVYNFGAPFYGSLAETHLSKPIVGMATDPATDGYWLVGSNGGVFAFNAPWLGSLAGRHLAAPIVGVASTPDGGGYWLLGRDGGVFAFGDAGYSGSLAGHLGTGHAVGIAAANLSDGDYLILTSSSVVGFGNEAGCGNGVQAGAVGMASYFPYGFNPGLDVSCYYTVPDYVASADGKVSLLGAAVAGATKPPAAVVSICLYEPTLNTDNAAGYWLTDSRGDVFPIKSPQLGSLTGRTLPAPIVAIAAG